jgi:hypothetical protein
LSKSLQEYVTRRRLAGILEERSRWRLHIYDENLTELVKAASMTGYPVVILSADEASSLRPLKMLSASPPTTQPGLPL